MKVEAVKVRVAPFGRRELATHFSASSRERPSRHELEQVVRTYSLRQELIHRGRYRGFLKEGVLRICRAASVLIWSWFTRIGMIDTNDDLDCLTTFSALAIL